MLNSRSVPCMSSRAVGFAAVLMMCPVASTQARAQVPITLGQASSFAVLGGSEVTNSGASAITGNIGVSPGTSITGFPPGTFTGTMYAGGPVAGQAHADLASAYGTIAGEAPTDDLTGQDLGGLTLTPGVYYFASDAPLTGTLTLNDEGNPNARFDFQIGSTLITASNAAVVTINGGTGSGGDIFWQVGSAATIGAGTAFEGSILALTSITFGTGATILDGRALAQTGAVTLISNAITLPAASADAPEPGSCALLLFTLPTLFTLQRRRRHHTMAP